MHDMTKRPLLDTLAITEAPDQPAPQLQTEYLFNWKVFISFLFLHGNICCGYSLEAPQRGASNEYPQHMFLWWNMKNICLDSPLIHLCCTHVLSHQGLHGSLLEWTSENILTEKAMIRLHRCAHWSRSLLFTARIWHKGSFMLYCDPIVSRML